MADTLSANLKLISQVNGENDGVWGDRVDTNWSYLDLKLGGTTAISTTGGTTTLTETEERVQIIRVTGALVSNATIEFSGRGGAWILQNDTTGAFSLTAKVTGETGVTVTQGRKAVLYCRGTDIETAVETADTSGLAALAVANTFTAAQTIAVTAAGTALTLESSNAGATSGPDLALYRNSATPANGDVLSTILWQGEDSAGNTETYARISTTVHDVTSTSEDASLYFGAVTAGTLANLLRLTGSALTPVLNDGLALGAGDAGFSDLFLASGGVVNFGASDVTLTHSANTLTVAGGDFVSPAYYIGSAKIGGAAVASFSAHKNGSGQVITQGGNPNKITFGTESFDVGGFFASNRWTPPAGTVLIQSYTGLSSIGSGGPTLTAALYKNGTEYKDFLREDATGPFAITTIESVSGSDYFEIFIDLSGNNCTVGGASGDTYFSGSMI